MCDPGEAHILAMHNQRVKGTWQLRKEPKKVLRRVTNLETKLMDTTKDPSLEPKEFAKPKVEVVEAVLARPYY